MSVPLQTYYKAISQDDQYNGSETSSYYSKIDAEPVLPSDDCCSKKKKWRKRFKGSCCFKFCRCLYIMILISTIFWLSMFLAMTVYSYRRYESCIHSPLVNPDVSSYEAGKVSAIDFNVITGNVVIEVDPSASDISVEMYKRSRHHRFNVEETISNQALLDDSGVLRISSVSTAFDYHSCQFATVHVVLPESVSLSLIGYVNTGSVVVIGTLNTDIVDVSIESKVGHVHIEKVFAKTVEISSKVGYSVLEAVRADIVKIDTSFGQIHTMDVISHQSFSAVAEIGFNSHDFISSPEVIVSTEWGASDAFFYPSRTNDDVVTVNTQYGHSYVGALVNEDSQVSFNVKTEVGIMAVEDDDEICAVDSHDENGLLGGCNKPSEQVKMADIQVEDDIPEGKEVVDPVEPADPVPENADNVAVDVVADDLVAPETHTVTINVSSKFGNGELFIEQEYTELE